MSLVSFIPPPSRRLVLNATQRDDLPVILIGEPGSGKGTLAKWIHESGPRSGRTYTVMNRKESWENQILKSNGGSVFFPEWETCDFSERECIQRLLKHRTFITKSEDGKSSLVHMVNVRLFVPALREDSALSDLLDLSALKSILINIPPLKERTSELLDIAHAILREQAHSQRKDFVSGFTAEATAALLSYDWPGNLRELRNVLSFSLTRCQSDIISLTDIPTLGDQSVDFFASREEFEKATMMEVLKQTKGNIELTAQSLRVSKEKLLEKMKIYRLDLSLVNDSVKS